MRALANLKHSVRERPPLESCGRCHTSVPRPDAECCWWCRAYLCGPCWEALGHCGHPEAEAENERARKVRQP